jgi:hypothetical protein
MLNLTIVKQRMWIEFLWSFLWIDEEKFVVSWSFNILRGIFIGIFFWREIGRCGDFHEISTKLTIKMALKSHPKKSTEIKWKFQIYPNWGLSRIYDALISNFDIMFEFRSMKIIKSDYLCWVVKAAFFCVNYVIVNIPCFLLCLIALESSQVWS